MGSVSYIRIEPGCLRIKFEWDSDTGKRTFNNTEKHSEVKSITGIFYTEKVSFIFFYKQIIF